MGRIQFTLGVFVVLMAALLAASGGHLWAAEGATLGQSPLFVDLEKVNNRYVITRISNQPLMIRLNDLKPQFDTRTYYCTQIEGNYLPEVYRPEMCKDDEKTFRRVVIDTAGTMATDFVTYFMNIVRGNVEKNSTFVIDEYTHAIEEALRNSGLDRERTLRSYDQFLGVVKEMRMKKESGYPRNPKDALSVQFNIIVDDRSGLYKNELTAQDLVALQPNDIPTFDPKTISFSGVDSAAIERDLSRAGEQYAAALDEAASYYGVEKLGAANPYTVRVDTPEKIYLKDGAKQTVPLNLTVLSKKIAHVSPVRYVNENKDLRVEDDGGKLALSNKSKKALQIETLTTHYGNQVVISPLNIPLAPGAVIVLEKSDKRLKHPRRESYQNVSKDSHQGQTLKFGYDVKYKFSGRRAQQRSLHKVNEHRVHDLLK